MEFVEIAAALISITAIFAYINYRVLKLPATIGLMIFAFSLSLLILISGYIWPGLGDNFTNIVQSIDFNKTLMHGMLAFLLFAGSLHVNLNYLAERMLEISIYATVGVLGSAIIVASLMYLIVGMIGIPLDFMHCLLFGALISPTDPIAVLGILKKAKAPISQEIQLTGESLFNDGIGVVVFLTLFGIVYPTENHTSIGFMDVLEFFAIEAVGGIAIGAILGYIAYRMLKSVDNYKVEVLITLALVMGGFTFADMIHTSGPLAIVVAGLLIGNQGRKYAMSDTTREHLDSFWELIDEILNAILFVLIGFELVVITINGHYFFAALLAIPACLLARFIAIGVPVSILRLFKRKFNPMVVRVLTWGGLRGGISVALALSIPPGDERNIILTVTYFIVAFSIIVQGLSVRWLILSARRKSIE